MQNKRAQIKAWLARTGRSYQNLADQMKVSLFTVNGWMSKNNIPQTQLERLDALMAADEASPAHVKVQARAEDFKTFPVLLTAEDYALCAAAAAAQGLSVSDWAADVCADSAAAFAKTEQEAAAAQPPA